jgi:hypothetical protein
LLFGWTPQDLRVPFAVAELNKTDIAKNVDAWLQQRKAELQKAQVHLEYARAAMIKARISAASSRTYAVGDQVKVSTRVLPLRVASTQFEKFQPKYLGPFTVVEIVNPGAYRLELPADYVAVHDVFNECDLRPYFDPGTDRDLD